MSRQVKFSYTKILSLFIHEYANEDFILNKHKHGKNAEVTLEQSMFTMLYLYDMA